MKPLRLAAALLLSALPLAGASAALPRFPQPFGDRVVFVAGGNIWSVAKSGGTATRLTSTPAEDMFPRVSPDGKWIAYTEAGATGTDVFVIPSGGGTARRLTFHPAAERGTGGRHGPDDMVVTWTPDSKNIVFLSKRAAWNPWIQDVFSVALEGGLATPLPIDAAGLLSYAPDGHTIAYNRIFRNFRTWKRYNGGLAQQVFTYDFDTKALTQITNWSGTNTSPMWVGRKIYYLSDQDSNRRANIWCYDLDTKQTREITHFTDYDIDFPAYGDNAIAFQKGGQLYVLDLPGETVHAVDMTVPDDGARTRPRVAGVKDDVRDTDNAQIVDYALSPNGKRALFSARGDIFSVPQEHGATRNLTSTQNADEDHPAWSPDGKMVAYTTDITGGQQIAVRPAAGGAERVLTKFADGYFYAPSFSPDGKRLVFSDNTHRLWLAGLDGAAPKLVAQDRFTEIHDASFSPDSRWMAFSMAADPNRRDLYLFDIASGKLTRLGDGANVDSAPAWSADGKYLYFLSVRHENTVLSDVEFDYTVLKSNGVYAIPLARDTASPVAPRSDEADAVAEDKPETKGAKAPAEKVAAPVHIDLDGLMARAVALPIEPAEIAQLDTRGHFLFYLTRPVEQIEGPLPGEKSALHVYDFEKRHDGVVMEDVDGYSLSLDGDHVLVKSEKDFVVADAKADAGKSADSKKTLDLDHLRMRIDPRAEWAEMFGNAWRLERDFFYSTVMNGVNWRGVRDQYAKLVPLAGSREDLNYIIGQMLGEMGNSHTYVGGGDSGLKNDGPSPGLLGADVVLDAASGRYRFATLYPGDNTREDYRSPLTEPGLNVKPGDYVLAINGVDLRAPADPDALLETSEAGDDMTVTLSIAETPSGKPRDIAVKPVAHELRLREAAWIAHNRDVVDKLSGGRVGYIYLTDMEQLGMQQFTRQFYAQLEKQALIVDDRWNNGGFIDQIVLERLRRVLIGTAVNRERAAASIPPQVIAGPKIALINHWSASDGDIFPHFFREYGLGKLLGTRTWGGVRGIRGPWAMMDGGYVTIPEDAVATLDSRWAIENHGVDPDIELENEPSDLLAGHDKQLKTAVALMVKAVGDRPAGLPAAPPLLPAYPSSGIVPPKP